MKISGRFKLTEDNWDLGELDSFKKWARKFLSEHLDALLYNLVKGWGYGTVQLNAETLLIEIDFSALDGRDNFPKISLSLEELLEPFYDEGHIAKKEPAMLLVNKLRKSADKIEKAYS